MINNVWVEPLKDSNNFKLMKKIKAPIQHEVCTDGNFYDVITNKCLGKEVTIFIHYFDDDGKELIPPIIDKIEWRK